MTESKNCARAPALFPLRYVIVHDISNSFILFLLLGNVSTNRKKGVNYRLFFVMDLALICGKQTNYSNIAKMYTCIIVWKKLCICVDIKYDRLVKYTILTLLLEINLGTTFSHAFTHM